MAWQKGPLPPGTYGWGGVVTKECESSGFYFADFRGDYVSLSNEVSDDVRPDKVLYYDNSITLPPCCKAGATRQTKSGAT